MARRKLTIEDMRKRIEEWSSDDSGSDGESSNEEESVPNESLNIPLIHMTESEDETEHSDLEYVSGDGDTGGASGILRTYQNDGLTRSVNGTEWKKLTSSRVGRAADRNIFRGRPGPKPVDIRTPYEAWKLFIDERMLRRILECTNHFSRLQYNEEFSLEDIESFIAIQYARGIYNKTLPIDFLWNKSYGPRIFASIMSRNKFKRILRSFRFDIKSTRRARLTDDKFALIRDIFESFRSNCVTAYTPTMQLTIDEQLLPVKSRCKLISFMPNKPDKYGIKFWLLVEVDTKYVCNIIPYLGAAERETRGAKSLAEDVVLRLIDPLKNRGYNVCCDNFFTSLDVANRLSDISTTIVGTLRKNRREFSKEMVAANQSLYESTFFWQEESNACFVSYQCKRNKNVCLLSTMHSSPAVSNNQKRKPLIVEFYNKNKVGVDVIDQMTKLYTTKSASRRWPLAVWSNILDISAINAWIVFKKISGKNLTRREFILSLISELRRSELNNTEESPRPSHIIDLPPLAKRRKCQQSNCRNCSSSYCKMCLKVTCGVCARDEKIILVKCNNCNK